MKIKLITLILVATLLVSGGVGAYLLLKDKDIGIIKTTKNDSMINIEDSKEKIEKLEEEKLELEKTIEEVENENLDLKKKVYELEKTEDNNSSTNSSSNKNYYSVEDVCEIVSDYLKNSDKNVKDVRINRVDIYTKEELIEMYDKDFIEYNFDLDNENMVYGEIEFDIKYNNSDEWECFTSDNGVKWIRNPENEEYVSDKDKWAIFDSRFFEIENRKNVKLGTSW